MASSDLSSRVRVFFEANIQNFQRGVQRAIGSVLNIGVASREVNNDFDSMSDGINKATQAAQEQL